jgi:2-oxoglutarate dehydrogenase E2 component (dihydrolipoamide succinyltransferase)
MAKVEVYLPKMGEGVIEATLTKWLVKVGEQIKEDDPLVEVATDKVDSEVPSPVSGVVKELKFKEGDIPQVGQVLLIVETEKTEEKPVTEEVIKEVERIKATDMAIPQPSSREIVYDRLSTDFPSKTPAGRFLSPLVRNIARQEKLTMEELESMEGTGMDGRLTKDDLMSLVAAKKEGKRTETARIPSGEIRTGQAEPSIVQPVTKTSSAQDEIIEMDRMRKLIAEHMIHSKQTSPHVTSFIEADVTNLVMWRNKVKDTFFEREKQKITFMPVFIEATAKALRDYPLVNASLDGTKIIKKKRINIGMATALPDGNLIVPVIKDADEKNLVGLAKSVNDLANRARNSKLLPDEIQGGTFTITNFGSFDSLTGTPIINQPELAILGIGAIRKKPAVIETSSGDAIAIRHIMILSLSYDHRVIDGALGGLFLKRVAEYLEGFDVTRPI